MEALPQLVELQVRHYKNLRDVYLAWNDGLALFGVNGAGKTNLLECLALLLGTGQAIGLAAPRLATPGPDDMAILAKPGVSALPWPPDVVIPLEDLASEADPAHIPGIERAWSDAQWWRLMGTAAGAHFEEGVRSAGLPDVVRDWLQEITVDPVVLYRLSHIERRPSQHVEAAEEVHRSFARTLMSRHAPRGVVALADGLGAQLPAPFAPLLAHLAARRRSPDGWVPVLELPATSRAPATLQWLPRSRTAEEVNTDLQQAFTIAGLRMSELTALLGEQRLFSTPLQEGDWHWLAHEIAAAHAQSELDLTLPDVEVLASGGNDADFALVSGGDERSHTGENDVLEPFSSGERRWIDEALAAGARELRRFAELAHLHAGMLGELDQKIVTSAIRDVTGRIEEELSIGEYWSGEAFQHLLRALEPTLIAAARAYAQDPNPLMEEVYRDQYPGLRLLQPQVVVRVFDEPEAHLHPAAQLRVAHGLSRLRDRGEQVVIASHSPHFLDLPGWSQVHVEKGAGGTTVEPLPEGSLGPRTSLAQQLGVNRGELLAGINALMIVEGPHDQVVLEWLYGAEMRSVGLAVVRMFGTNNLLATAELDFIDRYLDVPINVLLDNARVGRVEAGQPETAEECKLFELLQRSRERDRPFYFIGLDRPDIVCYLNQSAVRDAYPEFAGWPVVLDVFSGLGDRPQFKRWLRDEFGVKLNTVRRIESTLQRMKNRSLPPEGDLHRKLSRMLADVVTPHG